MEFVTHSREETVALGGRLADALKTGRVVAFTGDLGAGKTAFVSGMARALGVEERVTSPTFTIVNEYEGGRLPLFHFDMYRLGGADELFDMFRISTMEDLYSTGFFDYLESGAILAVEWSENVAEAIEDGAVRVSIVRGDGDNDRIIAIEGVDL